MSKGESKKRVGEEEEWGGRMIDAYIDLREEDVTICADNKELIQMVDAAIRCLEKRGFDTEKLQTAIAHVAHQYTQLEDAMNQLDDTMDGLMKQCLDFFGTGQAAEGERHE